MCKLGTKNELAAAVFLDRDGVINESVVFEGKPYPARSLGDLVLASRAEEALSLLKKSGYFLSVVTNQPDVGRGTLEKNAVESIHAYMLEALPLDDIRVCYDDGKRIDSDRRKPNPGMLLEAAEQHSLDLSQSFMIGDRWRDVEAGLNAGCRTIFIDFDYDEPLQRSPDHTVHSLWEAANLIFNLKNKHKK